MAKIVNITNGTGSENLINGDYTVTALVTGYDNTTINPTDITVDAVINEYAFSIAATGTLTLHVTDTGTSAGTPIVGATFIRTDATGNAVFNNVPYADTNAPTIYFKQTASDGDHEFDDAVQSTTLTTDTQTLEIQNTVGALRTITLTDANYENLPVDSGTLTFTNN